jgi:hypothetical protein
VSEIIDGVVIPRSADVGGDAPYQMTGDEAAILIAELYAAADIRSYKKVRLDRAQHPEAGDWFELGYCLGEVSVRWSHRPRNTHLRSAGLAAVKEFMQCLRDNHDFAVLESRKP